MKYLNSFNENVENDNKKKLSLINDIAKLILDNTKPNEEIYFQIKH